MHFIALGIVLLVLLIFLLNPKRWQRLSDSARSLRKNVEAGQDEDSLINEEDDQR